VLSDQQKGANMKTLSPLDAVTQFTNAMNKGDLEAALSFYEPGATLIVQPGVVATGTSALREALEGFVALRPTLTSEAHQVVEAGDVALYCSRWILRGTDPAGNPVQMSGRSSDILRRQPDGNWLIALDNPLGTDIVE
jgi:ketosteroid isomerase-like protein